MVHIDEAAAGPGQFCLIMCGKRQLWLVHCDHAYAKRD